MNNIIVFKPILTEKVSAQISLNKYVLEISCSLNKIEIKKFIEERYSVKIKKVNSLKRTSKNRRRGHVLGKTKVKKKVVLTLESGMSIPSIKNLY